MKVDILNTENRHQIIYADPPRRNPKSGTKARNNEKHYPSMATDEICRLPIREISADNAILFIWICFLCLEDGLKVIKSWEFEYYGLGFDWCKKSRRNAQNRLRILYKAEQRIMPCRCKTWNGEPNKTACEEYLLQYFRTAEGTQ